MTVSPLADDGGVRVLRADGELDVLSVPSLLHTARAMVEGARAVVLDLSAVTFLDSSGIRLVDRLWREAVRAGASYRVVAPPGGAARRVLDLVGLAALLAVDDLETALAAARG